MIYDGSTSLKDSTQLKCEDWFGLPGLDPVQPRGSGSNNLAFILQLNAVHVQGLQVKEGFSAVQKSTQLSPSLT